MADDREYLTAAEFAALPSDAHHIVWQAHADGKVSAVPAITGAGNGMRRYRRAQVRAVLREAAEARG